MIILNKIDIMKTLTFFFVFISISLKCQVIFRYDESGNQIYRGIGDANKNSAVIKKDDIKPTFSLADSISNKIQVAPVPVKTDLNVFWDKEIENYIIKIDLLPYNAFKIIETINISRLHSNTYTFKMSHLPYGVYYLKFYLSDNSIYTVTVTKN